MKTRPKPDKRPRPSAAQPPAVKPADAPLVRTLVPDAVPEAERIERQNDLA